MKSNVITTLFEQHAKVGAILVTYHGDDDLRLRRKAGRKSKRPGKR